MEAIHFPILESFWPLDEAVASARNARPVERTKKNVTAGRVADGKRRDFRVAKASLARDEYFRTRPHPQPNSKKLLS